MIGRPWIDAVDEMLAGIMTRERAEFVRSLRCGEPGYTWRAIADACHDAWGDMVTAGNQLHGECLCMRAAELLGEDPNAEPWN